MNNILTLFILPFYLEKKKNAPIYSDVLKHCLIITVAITHLNYHISYLTVYAPLVDEGSALKTARREVSGFNPSHAFRPSRLKFSHGFFWNSRKSTLRSLRKTSRRMSPCRSRSCMQTIGLYPITQPFTELIREKKNSDNA